MRTPVELHDTWLRVDLGGSTGDFHYRWLRHNCPCDVHPTTRERTLCSSQIAEGIAPRAARRVAYALEVTWPDGHVSDFPIEWLRARAYAVDTGLQPPYADLASLLVDAAPGDLQGLARAAMARIQAAGAAVFRRPVDAPASDPEAETEPLIAAFESLGLAVIPTHFGRIEDLRTDNTTNQNTDQLGYTDAPVDLHTDQPFIADPPRFQLLHCVRAADEGGDNLLADARSIFRYLEATDARAAEVLATVPLRFHRKQARFESVVDSPMIARRGDDDFQIRASYFTLAPHRAPFAAMAELYRAHDAFVRMLRDPRYHARVGLRPGEWLIYDNHRCLHARTGFTGARWLRGVYFDRPAPLTAR
ncbi:MAG: TauD/TfdA family dioxygenase [Nannocystaceae bacterium]